MQYCQLISLGKINNVRPSIVISNNPDAAGLKIASEKFGVATRTLLDYGSKGCDVPIKNWFQSWKNTV